MRFQILVATLVLGPALIADQSRPPDWYLQVGLFGYRPDGTVSATAFESQFPRSSFVYVTESGCGVGAGISPQGPKLKPFYAWSFTGKVIDITPEAAVIQLDWQRVIDAGQPATSPSGSVQLTLQAGDRVLLDSIVPPATGTTCWSNVAFEARYRANPFFSNIQLTVKPDGTVRSGGGPLTAASGGGTSDAGAVAGSRSSGAAGSDMSVLAERAVSARGPGTATQYNVHLWLVRSSPGQPEEAQYQKLPVLAPETPFTFIPISIDTPRGPMTVTVGGSLDVQLGSGSPHALLRMRRTATPAADGTPSTGEITGYVKLQPGDQKVMSVEMPPIRLDDQQLPDRFSLRLRVEPR